MIHGWTVNENMQILQFDICLLTIMRCNQFNGEGSRIESNLVEFKVREILKIKAQLGAFIRSIKLEMFSLCYLNFFLINKTFLASNSL